MSCYHPHYALDLGINSDTGKHKIKFLPKRYDMSLQSLRYKYGENSILSLPCGHCVGCVLDYAREWAVRCTLESFYYRDQTWFITLTYDDKHVPEKLEKEPLQKFIRSLRDRGFKIRYFGCGELGSSTFRPHHHILVFGLPLNDLKLFSKTKNGNLYTSQFIDSVWEKGFCTIAKGSFDTAGYIARYCLKKRLNKNDGEYIIMSKRPGLGERYFIENKDKVLDYMKIVDNFGKIKTASVPRYFEKLSEKLGIDLSIQKGLRLDLSKKLTRAQMLSYSATEEEILYQYKENEKLNQVNHLRRSL